MERYLPSGYRLNVPAGAGVYEIKCLIGTGASCAVYRAECRNGSGMITEHLLKEYNPRRVRLARDDTGALHPVEQEDYTAFDEGLHLFRRGYEKQAEVRSRSDLKNTTSNIQREFPANGTHYIDLTVMEGKTYDQVEEASLYDLLRRLKSITQIVARYHSAGLLHLDIKPENILVIPETVEYVQMFDFDSVTPKEEICSAKFLSCTQSWAAPEQLLPNRRNRICEATDLFAIGEMLFVKIMGRHSDNQERRSFANYQMDPEHPIFRGVNPGVMPLLSDILRHTICNQVSGRYQTAGELIGKLTAAIALSDPRKPFLQHHLPGKAAFFVGRENLMLRIEEKLRHTNELFLSGMGGIGKSEIARQYAHAHKQDYNAVIFCMCDTNLEAMILNDSMLPIVNVQRAPDEQPMNYFNRKMRELTELCDENILLVVDNLNNLEDRNLKKLRDLNCKLLVTTRCDATQYNYSQLSVDTLEDPLVWEIFRKWYPAALSEADASAARELIDLYQGHTMAVELLAKQMEASCIPPVQMLEKIMAHGLGETGRERFVHNKDGSPQKMNIQSHIRRLFDVSDLSRGQIYVLANLSLIPPSGIRKQQFYEWCSLESYGDINDLQEYGWLRCDGSDISLHPIVADCMTDVLMADPSICERLLESIIRTVESDSFGYAEVHFRNWLYTLMLYIVERKMLLQDNTCVLARLINVAALNFYKYGAIGVLLPALEQVVIVYESNIQKWDQNTAEFHNTLGHLYQDSKQFDKAEEQYTKSLEIIKSVYGENHEKSATAYNNLGSLYRELCLYDQSEKYYKSALEIWKATRGDCDTETAKGYNNLGNLYLSLQKWEDAESHLLKSLDIMQRLRAQQHSLTATIYMNLGSLYRRQSVFEKAHECLLKSISIARIIFGDKHSTTSHAYNAIGLLHYDMRDYAQAQKYYEAALEISCCLYGEYHIESARIYINLALSFASLKQYTKAEELYEKAKCSYLSAYGKRHEAVAILYFNIGALYEKWGKLEQSKAHFQESLSINQELFGANSTNTIIALISIARICKKLRQFESAQQYYDKVLQIRRTVLGEDHYDTACTYVNCGVIYEAMRQYDRAIECCRRALDILVRRHGQKHKSIATTYIRLGLLYFKIRDYDEAIACYLSALNVMKTASGITELQFAAMYRHLGVCYREKGLHEKALQNLEHALAIMTSADRADDVEAASIYSAIGKSHALAGEFEVAENYYHKALEIRLRHFGQDHPSVRLIDERIRELHN